MSMDAIDKSADISSRAKQMVATRRESGLESAIRDSLTIGWRNLIRLTRTPSAIVSVLLFPIIFLSCFLFAFGRFMSAQGIDYIQYLVPIITLQAIFFTAMGAAVTLTKDVQSGMLQRCRSMPISRVAILGGLMIAYLIRAAIATAILLVFAHIYGFRFETGILSVIAYFAIALLFAATAIAGYSALALKVRQLDLVQSLLIVPYAPFLLLSNGFTPAENFPSWLQPFVQHQPVSYTAAALRAFSSRGEDLLVPAGGSLLWLTGLLVLLSLIAVRLYRGLS
ncbi:ABC transporter permease [Geitlerinema calcuttense]|uniref:Transport permease protein n=1 Tax=Geitlerinema calcuttense NRMC-F 0142 TaxID=2922238 RepID=A0ABT7M319_9CYAN|nr:MULTISPECIES: ABC transporter permease [Cyanophyceae]MDL5052268.1 ABC transporter permease [Oscillatoria laete-virens NRMC-F 0139]MDL5057770.1 ABC transporter permease [Geitlerinema calcuttense NRMC-F 0142]